MTKLIVYDLVEEMVNGFSKSKLITCPSCKSTIDLFSLPKKRLSLWELKVPTLRALNQMYPTKHF